MVSGGMACVKYLLFLFNLIFAITGIVLISFGGVILAMYSGYKNFMDNWFFAAPVLMIVVGVTVFLVSFCGCWGSIKENYCMIITFSVLLLLIFALELGAGISGYVMSNEVGKMLETRLNNTMYHYKTDMEIKKSWDIMQHDLKCCGMNGPTDWTNIYGNSHIELPDSCCYEIALNKKCDTNSVTVNNEGCMKSLIATIESKALILGAVGIGIALIQFIGVIFACCLARSIRREYETV